LKYYYRNVGDYLKDTMHLSLAEDGAYGRLMDIYYSREAPLPRDLPTVYRMARATTKNDKAAVLAVLKEFFTATPDGYRHERCDQEVSKAASKKEAARNNANMRWHPDGNAPAMQTHSNQHSDGNAPKPLTSNLKSKEKESDDQKVASERRNRIEAFTKTGLQRIGR
jgi:uncharacterized protein YdaU (DUF1376 family)